ncbi:MAG: UDP-N-acetylmuramate--L-alanine ligase [Anaerolineaceae bacterium]|nr:UDP-N-acetylmuramate--L-alanine ligase [Anaerolineaceae bacterium]
MKHVHFIGIGGSGLSALARLLLERGYAVSGSDQTLSPAALELADAGVRVTEGHTASNIAGASLVIRSSAIPDENPEVLAAQAAGIPVLKRADILDQLTAGRTVIAVAGTHGKTTTTAMIAWALVSLGQDPSYIIGGIAKDLGTNAHAGSGNLFVIEADEYDRMFIGLTPDWIVLTNVEHDHPDCFPTPEEYRQAFCSFISQLKPGGTLLACTDDPGARVILDSLPPGTRALSYGLRTPAEYTATGIQNIPGGGARFNVIHTLPQMAPNSLASMQLKVPGEHNLLNALAAMALFHQMGLDPAPAATALAQFSGAGRRFDLRGEVNQITLIDDYAHHPTEIKATLAAARARFPGRRVWAVWQPHTYSRTQTLQAAFCEAFENADQVLVTEVFAAREKNNPFSAAQLVAQMPHPAAKFCPTLESATRYLLDHLQPGDVVLVLSAGDADRITAEVLDALQKRTHAERSGA